MKPSVIIALIVGAVVGFAVGSMFQKPSDGSNTAAVVGAPTPGNNPQAVRAPSPAGAGENTVYKVPLDESPIRGPASALVTIVEIGRAHV